MSIASRSAWNEAIQRPLATGGKVSSRTPGTTNNWVDRGLKWSDIQMNGRINLRLSECVSKAFLGLRDLHLGTSAVGTATHNATISARYRVDC